MEDSDHRGERDDDRAKYLFLSLLQARVGSSLVARLGNLAPEALFETPFSDLADWGGTPEKAASAFDELQQGFDIHAIEGCLGARGIRVVTLADDEYPGLLRTVPDPPPSLYIVGRVPETASVALVGSRKASATGLETARALGRALSERGVDAAAHRGALAAKSPTVGVLGCGIDVTYPTKYKRSRVALPRYALRGPHPSIDTNEGLGTPRGRDPKGAPEGAQTATARAWWRSCGKLEPSEDALLPHASIPRCGEAHASGPMARRCCVILARKS